MILLKRQNIKTFLQKAKFQTGLKKLIVFKKIKSIVPWTYLTSGLKGEQIVGTFHKNKLQKTIQKYFRAEKVIKKKRNKIHVKWKGYDSSWSSWFDKKDIV